MSFETPGLNRAKSESCLSKVNKITGRIRIIPKFFFFLLAASIPIATLAQEEASSAESEVETFVVSNFVVEGSNPLSEADTKGVLSAYVNKSIDLAQLQNAALELQNQMTSKGYSFYRTSLPPQVLNSGVVKLAVEKINIGQINVLGNKFFSNNNIKKSMPILKVGESPNTQSIASALLLAEENPSKDLRVMFVKGSKPRTIDANIRVTDENPNAFSVWANNAGSSNTSQSRLGLQYHNRNLWGLDHQASLSFTTSPEKPSELSQYGLNYKVPVYKWGGVANFFYSRSDADTGRVADVFDISGAGDTFGLGYTHIFRKIGNYQHRFSATLADKLFDSDVFFNSQNIGTDIRSRPLTIDYTTRFDKSNWVINSVLSHSTNLSGGSFNDDESYNLSRLGASQDWSKTNVNVRFDQRWNREWSFSASVGAQITSDSLISGEKYGLGGGFGNAGPRGFNEREVSADEGYKVSLEAVRAFENGKYRLGAFVDYAKAEQNSVQVGEFESDTLSSVGISFDWRVREDFTISADYGYILDGVQQIDGISDTSSDDGDDRLHLSIRYFPKWPSNSGFGGE